MVLVKFVAFRKESAVPDVATPASHSADVQPEKATNGAPESHLDMKTAKHYHEVFFSKRLWP